MRSSAAVATSGSRLIGHQFPRLSLLPPVESPAAGDEAIRIGRLGGIVLDPWQELVLRASLAESSDWKCPRCAFESPSGLAIPCPSHPDASLVHPWAVRDVGLIVPRQNGKDEVLIVRELYEVFVLGSRLVIHSAHRLDAALEHFERLKQVIYETPEFSRRLWPDAARGIKSGNNAQVIRFLIDGRICRIAFRTRKAGGGRAFSADLLVLNEAFQLYDAFLGDLMPTLSARPNPQLWFTSTAVNKREHPAGIALSRLRRSALKAIAARERGVVVDEDLAYLEWSAPGNDPDLVEEAMLDDDEPLRQANPSVGRHLSRRACRAERRRMDRRQYAVERLGVGDWYGEEAAESVIDPNDWKALGDPIVEPLDPVAFAFEVAMDLSWSAIGVAGWTEERDAFVEVVAYRVGTDWVAEELLRLRDEHKPRMIVFESTGEAATLLPAIQKAGLKLHNGRGHVPRGAVIPLTGNEFARACGGFVLGVEARAVKHRGVEKGFGPKLADAIKKVQKTGARESAWKWSRKNSPVDISPLVVVTLAHHAISKFRPGAATVVDPWEILAGEDEGRGGADLYEEMLADAREFRRSIVEDDEEDES